MSGDGGGGCVEGDSGLGGKRITKRDLLNRIEALERTVKMLQARVPDRIVASPALPPGWPYATCSGQTNGQPGINVQSWNTPQ